ncbi:helix-turn-helix domain-containing protein [Paenibacillus sp. QZ-Y1]|uniref:helix-turn-helix domain-containing protein n=1 Tax=Paenibacillus sp. QZ-Y1 TaxID=3414511 RepID=UPI003F79FFE8
METFSLNNKLGDLLKNSRLQREWSLRTAGEESGVSHTHIGKLEKGVVPKPAPEQLKKLANAYDLSYNMLMLMAGYKEEVQVPEQFIDDMYSVINDVEEYDNFVGDDYYNSLEKISIDEPNQEILMFSEERQETIGDRIKQLREVDDYSISDLSDRMTGKQLNHDFTVFTKYSPKYIEEVETGKEDASISFLVAVSDFFKVSIDWIITGKDYTSKETVGKQDTMNFHHKFMAIAKRIVSEMDEEHLSSFNLREKSNLNDNIEKK